LPADYEIGAMLGHGSIGDSYRGRMKSNGRSVRIKGLHGFLAQDANARWAFFHAAKQMAKLRHDGVVQILEVGPEDAPDPWFVTEDLAGTTLEHLVRRHGCPPAEYAALIGYRLAQVLSYAHSQKVVHGNVKPEHVLITENGTVKLISFGLANVAASQVERTGSALGNPAFMAPEQVVGAQTDARSDVYSLGALLYYLICGRAPYEVAASVQATREVTSGGFPPIKRLNPDAPDRLVTVVGRSLSILPEARPDNMALFAAELVKLFKEAGLSPKRHLPPFLLDEWPAVVPVTAASHSSSARERADTEGLPHALDAFDDEMEIDLDPTASSTPRLAQAVPRPGNQISLPVALAAALAIAIVAFAAGYRYGESRARASIEQDSVSQLQPVEVHPVAPGDGKASGGTTPSGPQAPQGAQGAPPAAGAVSAPAAVAIPGPVPAGSADAVAPPPAAEPAAAPADDADDSDEVAEDPDEATDVEAAPGSADVAPTPDPEADDPEAEELTVAPEPPPPPPAPSPTP
jgi:serine/threonine protein kinase